MDKGYNINVLRNHLLDTGDYTIEQLQDLTPYELFDKWLRYEGIIGYTDEIIASLSNATSTDLFNKMGVDW